MSTNLNNDSSNSPNGVFGALNGETHNVGSLAFLRPMILNVLSDLLKIVKSLPVLDVLRLPGSL